MITTTHVVINVAIGKAAERTRYHDRITPRALVAGALAPDAAFALLSAAAFIYYPIFQGRSLGNTFRHVTNTMYFESPLWIVGHHTLHSPLSLCLLFLLTALFAPPHRRRTIVAFLVGCFIHAVVDIATHHDDGPLVLFPLDWTTRLHSPVSYWDAAHHADIIRPIDLAITSCGLIWLALAASVRRSTKAKRWPTQAAARRDERDDLLL